MATKQPLYAEQNKSNDTPSGLLEAPKKQAATTPVDPVIALRQEIDIMLSLRHPNIVALHEVCN